MGGEQWRYRTHRKGKYHELFFGARPAQRQPLRSYRRPPRKCMATHQQGGDDGKEEVPQRLCPPALCQYRVDALRQR